MSSEIRVLDLCTQCERRTHKDYGLRLETQFQEIFRRELGYVWNARRGFCLRRSLLHVSR